MGWGDVPPSRADRNPRPRQSSLRVDGPGAAALWNTTCEVTRDRICYGLKDQGSTAPVRTLALASFSLLTFLSLFLSSFLPLSSFLASLSSPFLESLESLDLSLESLESLESFFSSFLTAFSSCERRARDGARAARGVPSRHRRDRRDRRESKTPRAHLLLLLLLGARFLGLVVLFTRFLFEVAALRVQG